MRSPRDVPPVITSGVNPQIKMMRSLGRRKIRHAERAFLVEGRRLVEEAARNGSVRVLLAREDIPDAWLDALPIDAARVRRVRAEVFDAASEVEHAQGVAAICDLPDTVITPEALIDGPLPVLILDRLRDPGNMGTALRSAAAAGVTVVLATTGSVDPWAPKAVRAGMGAHFRLRVGHLTPKLLSALQASGGDIVHADAGGVDLYTEYPWARAAALVVGGETDALSADVASAVTRTVAIPMAAGMESLNAAVAASVLLYEAQRQARATDPAPWGVDISPEFR